MGEYQKLIKLLDNSDQLTAIERKLHIPTVHELSESGECFIVGNKNVIYFFEMPSEEDYYILFADKNNPMTSHAFHTDDVEFYYNMIEEFSKDEEEIV